MEAFYKHGHKHFNTDRTAHLFPGGKYGGSLGLRDLPMSNQLVVVEPSLNQLFPTHSLSPKGRAPWERRVAPGSSLRKQPQQE